ncbi:ATP-binding protein [Actinomadura graeca]|uniref:ATP-binding protein n=1 Tax=Actinomadura graeca TaxID=2750812 RepID=A0ABX8QNV4_9ACTN|nr:ATP-binding protein [Actinomadura graeca]QXJ20283.1 ATP-binding protein [Actinomadura graeca]
MASRVFAPPIAEPSIEIGLASAPNAVGLVRKLVCEWYRHWQSPATVIEAAELVTSELATNAIKADGREFRVRLRWDGTCGYVEVWDADPNPPVQQVVDETDLGGRGLLLVSQYAARWGFYSSDGGKVVWAELRVAGA